MRSDTLLDGSELYVALRDNKAVSGNPRQSLLFRMSYAGSGRWSAPGSPVVITTKSPSVLTIAKDGMGRVWAAFRVSTAISVGYLNPGEGSFVYQNLSAPAVPRMASRLLSRSPTVGAARPG